MDYNGLRLEVITLMQNFRPDEVLIKKRIENLIEREYITKDKQDENILLYKPWNRLILNIHNFKKLDKIILRN